MKTGRLRLLYLSNAFPPGVGGRFPSLCASSHPQETRMAVALGKLADVQTVGLLPRQLWRQLDPRDDSIGLEHSLILWDRNPKLWHRWRSWRRLRTFYREEIRRHGIPDVILVRNLCSGVFNAFVRWLRSQPRRPLIVQVLADSGLGQPVSAWRRLRYRFKPVAFLEEQAIHWYDACLGFGIESRRHFEPLGIPWQWMPAAYNFYYEPPATTPKSGPVQFGYFGGISAAVGVQAMVQAFLTSGIPGSLRLCGFGGLVETVKQLAATHPNLHFDGVKTQTECLSWAQQFDVLVNPRLPHLGWDNSFPSKLFEYAMTGKAILSTRTCGVDKVLLDEGLYLDAGHLEDSLREKFREISNMDRNELQRRGGIIRQRIVNEYNWEAQARRMIDFLTGLVQAREEN
jgi:glycosyltransferase involved in cell wall biosynthesis